MKTYIHRRFPFSPVSDRELHGKTAGSRTCDLSQIRISHIVAVEDRRIATGRSHVDILDRNIMTDLALAVSSLGPHRDSWVYKLNTYIRTTTSQLPNTRIILLRSGSLEILEKDILNHEFRLQQHVNFLILANVSSIQSKE